jgi:predicted choloylglycine hydrolase
MRDGLCRLSYLSQRPLWLEDLRTTIEAHRQIVEQHLPALAREIDGLAEGAGLSREQAWLLQLRREIIGYSRITSGDCTTFASVKNAPLLAQTVDLNGNLDDFISVLETEGPQYRSLILSFSGLLGYLGMNSAGLAVGLNLVLGGRWRAGIPPYLAIRHLLDSCDCVESALATLSKLPLSSSRSFTLCDTRWALCVEVLSDKTRVLEQKTPVHTNHYLHPAFVAHDELNIFARNSSLQRLAAVEALVAKSTCSVEQCFDLFSRAPVCVQDNGDIRRERTVAAVVMQPLSGIFYLRPGDPYRSTTQIFSLTKG